MRIPFRTISAWGSFVLLMSFCIDAQTEERIFTYDHGGIVRGDRAYKELALVFTGDSFAEGGEYIQQALARHRVKGSFFFTGNFYRNSNFHQLIVNLGADGHYLGARTSFICSSTNC